MSMQNASISLTLAVILFASPTESSGQEVNGDVKIPAPRAVAVMTPAASGLGGGTATSGAASPEGYEAAIRGTIAAVRSGAVGEAEARAQLGDFTVSLLVRAGVISFSRDAGAPRRGLAASTATPPPPPRRSPPRPGG